MHAQHYHMHMCTHTLHLHPLLPPTHTYTHIHSCCPSSAVNPPFAQVGSGYHVSARGWASPDSTIGPGSDSYYEYALKVCVGVAGWRSEKMCVREGEVKMGEDGRR